MLRHYLPIDLIRVALASLCLLMMPAQAEESPVIAVIVSSNTDIAPVNALTATELRLIFWRKKEYWQGGQRMQPANLHAEHPLRLLFSSVVLNNLPKDQTDYWNERYFHGVRPPHSLLSEEAMLRYVADTRGSIGYVDACHIDKRVQPILWISKERITAEAPNLSYCK